ncbi:MAG: glycoside hydrolase family 3 C-terminal domain-containing protein [Acidobacteriaceae bacterium]
MYRSLRLSCVVLPLLTLALLAQGPQKNPAQHPWQNTSLSPEQRADLVLKSMTLDEKIALIHGTGQPGYGAPTPEQQNSNGGAGYVVGVPRLGIPGIQMADAAYGVTKSETNGRYSTALPSSLALAATWDTATAQRYGALIGRELRDQGYNMTLGGGVDIARELRNGRTFEYGGEDPLLAGIMIGSSIKGLQAQHVIGDVKHYAVNDQEDGRTAVNAIIGEKAMRETDLLAFQLAIRTGHPAAVMCSYNRVNGEYACQNHHLLTDVLRTDWGYKGFVLSDWGGTHSTVEASHAGLDQEQPNQYFYGAAYKHAIEAGSIPQSELDQHVRRILYAEFSSGVVDDPVQKAVVDPFAGARTSQRIAEESIVLLKNQHAALPIDPAKHLRIAVIGLHADVGMISGGGSAQVDPPGGNAIMPPGKGRTEWMEHIWFPSSPLRALKAALPHDSVQFASGEDLNTAAELARNSDLVIVFAYQWESEGMDLPSLSLPDHQDQIIQHVAAANSHTVVVLETGTAALMPWASSVSAIVESWYSGTDGAQAVADVLTGEVNPSGKLPITFPLADSDLPHPTLITPPPASTAEFYGAQADEHDRAGLPPFNVTYNEGVLVGYKWYATKHKAVLFPFGYGLSYTTFALSDMHISPDARTAQVTVTNTGNRPGRTVAELYASLPAAADEPQRLAGWEPVTLQPHESRKVTIAIEPLTLSVYDLKQHAFTLLPGSYTFHAGSSSADLPLTQTIALSGEQSVQ